MKNKTLLIFMILAIFSIGITISSVSALDNTTTDNLTIVDDSNSIDNLNAINEVTSINASTENNSTISNEKLGVSKSESSEVLSLNVNSQDNILSSSASSSNKGHTYHINGYTFTVSASQYAKIKKAIKIGKTHDWLESSFDFKVKTNKIYTYKKPIYKTKKVTKYKWKYKKLSVSQVKYWEWEYKYYTSKKTNGWTCYKLMETDFDYGVPHKHYVYLKKKVKYKTTKKVKTGKYKKVKMRVYANIRYIGSDDYVTGEWLYYPWVDFNAMKKGYSTQYLGEAIITK